MNLHQLWKILSSRHWIIWCVFAASVLSAFVATRLIKPQYTATAQLYVNLADANGATNAQVPGAVVRNYISTQVEAIRSRGTALLVVEREKLAADPAWKAAFAARAQEGEQIDDWVASVLMRGLEVMRQAASDVISISYRSDDRELAAKMANAFAGAFLRKDVELRVGSAQELSKWYDERLALLRVRFLEVETKRSELRLQAIRRGDVEATGAQDPLSSMATQMANARNAVLQAKAALEMARNGQGPAAENPELLALRKQVTDTELALKRELPLLGESHRRIQFLRTNLQQSKVQVEAASVRLRADLIADKERELAAAERRVEETGTQMSRDETQRHDQVKSRAEAVALDREIESLRSQIDLLVQRRERSIVESAASQGNTSILSQAAIPSSPSWPRIPLVMALAAALGLAFGLALAFLREMFDRRVRCSDDLTAYFNAPLLGDIKGQKLSKAMAKLPPSFDRLAGRLRDEAPKMLDPAIEAVR
ncbi:GumC family protein [Bosea sp. UC22_33]|uniref:GumC family protein n=1 Tax=Bosea sp. UC22_33 TaxID=3350165 RepID=UPI003670BEAB